MEIPKIEYSNITLSQKQRFFPFTNMKGIVIPPTMGFAIAYDSSNNYFMGIVVSLNGEKGYVRRNEETVLIRTCETFLGRKTCRSEEDIAVKLE
jgi:hypothetical protein